MYQIRGTGRIRDCRGCSQVDWICDQYEKSKHSERVSNLIEYSCATTSQSDELPLIFSEVPSASVEFKGARGLTQVQWLTWRSYVDYKRNSASHLLRFVSYMVRCRFYWLLPFVPVSVSFDFAC